MILTAGDRPIMVVEKVWHPFKSRAFRVVTCQQGGKTVRAVGSFPVKQDDLILIERVWPFWIVGGLLR